MEAVSDVRGYSGTKDESVAGGADGDFIVVGSLEEFFFQTAQVSDICYFGEEFAGVFIEAAGSRDSAFFPD
jgi:hypothetical protein